MTTADELSTEAEIQAKGLNAPRLTPADIDYAILTAQYHVFPGTTLTVCAITLKNGYIVTGESAAASPENFDEVIGCKIAFGNARNKIWALEGYLLRERLSAAQFAVTAVPAGENVPVASVEVVEPEPAPAPEPAAEPDATAPENPLDPVIIKAGTEIKDGDGRLIATVARDITATRRHSMIEEADFRLAPEARGNIMHPAITAFAMRVFMGSM